MNHIDDNEILNSTKLKEALKDFKLPVAEALVIFDQFDHSNNSAIIDDRVKSHILFEVIVYSVLFVIGAFSNLLVLYKLTSTKRKTPLNILISQLNIADLIVMITIPIEIFFDLTILWETNMLTFCQLLQTLRTLGFYLSSMILICISIDRYYAFVHPLTFYNTRKRNKRMAILAWVASILLSIPQSTIVHLKYYPQVQGLVQCVTFGYLKNKYMAAFINFKSILALYFAPLSVIVYCYVRILMAIHNVPDFMRKDQKRISRRKSPSVQSQASVRRMPVSRSFPSYSCLTLEQTSFSLNDDLEEEEVDRYDFHVSNFEKLIDFGKERTMKDSPSLQANRDRSFEKLEENRAGGRLNERLSLGDKLNERIKEKINEKLIDRKMRKMDEQATKISRRMTDLNDKLIDYEISLFSSTPEDQIRKRRFSTSRPRIVLNRRSESMSISRENAKIKLNKNKRIGKDLKTIETKKFEIDLKSSDEKCMKMKDRRLNSPNVNESNQKDNKVNVRSKNGKANDIGVNNGKIKDLKVVICKDSKDIKSTNTSGKHLKTSKIYQLINKAKGTKKSNKNKNSKDKSMKPFKIERSRSQEDFGDLKAKRQSRMLEDDLDQINTSTLVNSREIIMSRAKRKTLKMTLLIVLAFVGCWTPYVIMVLWHQVFEESASKVNEWVQELFFLLAVANSCANGLVVYSIHM